MNIDLQELIPDLDLEGFKVICSKNLSIFRKALTENPKIVSYLRGIKTFQGNSALSIANVFFADEITERTPL